VNGLASVSKFGGTVPEKCRPFKLIRTVTIRYQNRRTFGCGKQDQGREQLKLNPYAVDGFNEEVL
jgi:hypothetical protein